MVAAMVLGNNPIILFCATVIDSSRIINSIYMFVLSVCYILFLILFNVISVLVAGLSLHRHDLISL